MERLLDNVPLYVGGDSDYEKVKNNTSWSVLRCCKEGSGGHRQTLGYNTIGAPKGKHYLFADQSRRRALNFIDPIDPNFIPIDMIRKGLEFIDARIKSGDKVLVACNAGHSRGPTTAMLYLRSIGELPYSFSVSERMFSTLYPMYEPGEGMRTFAKRHWNVPIV